MPYRSALEPWVRPSETEKQIPRVSYKKKAEKTIDKGKFRTAKWLGFLKNGANYYDKLTAEMKAGRSLNHITPLNGGRNLYYQTF